MTNKFERDWILHVQSVQERIPQLSTKEMELLKKYDTKAHENGTVEMTFETLLKILKRIDKIQDDTNIEGDKGTSTIV